MSQLSFLSTASAKKVQHKFEKKNAAWGYKDQSHIWVRYIFSPRYFLFLLVGQQFCFFLT